MAHHSRTPVEQTMSDAASSPSHVSAQYTRISPHGSWAGLASVDRRVWLIVAGIGAFGALVTAGLARDLHRSPLIPVLIMTAAAGPRGGLRGAGCAAARGVPGCARAR
jgi:hypothetical protein